MICLEGVKELHAVMLSSRNILNFTCRIWSETRLDLFCEFWRRGLINILNVIFFFSFYARPFSTVPQPDGLMPVGEKSRVAYG